LQVDGANFQIGTTEPANGSIGTSSTFTQTAVRTNPELAVLGRRPRSRRPACNIASRKESAVAHLQRIRIWFVTHTAGAEAAWGRSVVHVFVRNRHSDTSRPTPSTDFVSNLLAYEAAEEAGPFDVNPYLGRALALRPIPRFGGSTPEEYEIPLRTQPIPLEEVVLPVVDVHLYSPLDLLWAFSYTITFEFDDGSSFSDTSDKEGITSILLDNNNCDFSGICVERPGAAPPTPVKPPTAPIYLTSVTLTFGTHGDDKAGDTSLNVHIANRTGPTSSEDIAIATNLFAGQSFAEGSRHTVVFSDTVVPGQDWVAPLASPYIQLQEIVLPIVYVIVDPTGGDRWIFDYQVTYAFDNGRQFTSRTNNVSLGAGSEKHAGAYNGTPFPAVAPPKRTTASWEPTWVQRRKQISLSYVQQKLTELLERPGLPYFKLRLDSVDEYGTGARQSYYAIETITPDPPSPGTPSFAGYSEGVRWSSSPSSLGFLPDGVYFQNLNSASVTVEIDPTSPMPITAKVVFATTFWVEIHFTLDLDPTTHRIDALSWIRDPGFVSSEPIVYHDGVPVVKVHFEDTESLVASWVSGVIQKRIREDILQILLETDRITGQTTADKLNAHFNGWLLGGVIEGPHRCTVNEVQIDGDILTIDYTRPSYAPPRPNDWPEGVDFSRGALANIEHIVVLTKENRSFDSMLGYLSLPVAAGGQGRDDIDGLKGGEFNLLAGQLCPSFPFEPQDTIFSPNSPQDSQRTLWQVDGGRMDGFVEAYADQNGVNVAPRIMGYHNAVNVPVYDALSRDFAICNRWFAPHPGPTFPNRFYELSGWLNMTPDGLWYSDNSTPLPEFDNASPVLPALIATIFDHLPERVSWRYFEQGYCFLRLFADHTFDSENIVSFDDPEIGFLALAQRGELPNVSFVDPHFIDLPPGGTCDEPPSDVKDGQELVRKVVEAVVCSPQWEKTLLIITYDEHGGFFDHVASPPATKVRPEAAETYGVRVPTFVISPWIRGGSVFGHDGPLASPPGPSKAAEQAPASASHGDPEASGPRTVDAPVARAKSGGPLAPLHFDHTSILKTIARCFLSSEPPYLGARYAAAHDLSSIMTASPRSSQFRPFIPYTLVYAKSGKGLEVQHGGFSPGAPLWQDDPDLSVAWQRFRLEDAGDGYWYLRTHVGTMYVTADPTTGIVQELKYAADGSGGDPDSQRWKLTTGITPESGFTIWNAASPGKTLQPDSESEKAGAAIVLGDPAEGVGAVHVPNAWHVSSPLLPDTSVFHP
jgi:phospholipase C